MFQRNCALCFIVLLHMISSAHAVSIYTYRNQDGGTLFTNQVQNNKTLTKMNVTYYPDSNIHSYKNWGKSESAVLPSFSQNKNKFDSIISSAAAKYQVPEGLVKAIMHTESSFNIYAKSPVGAQGLMQLMPATAKRFNVNDSYNPHENIHAGAKYLSILLKRFNGNTSLALAAYNAGEGNIHKYGGIPPFKETQNYVVRVMSRYKNLYASQLDLVAKNIERPASKSIKPAYYKKIVQTADGTYTEVTTAYAVSN
ncbi:lytic transglycosylase domain-containing protein [Acinetobacter apis]